MEGQMFESGGYFCRWGTMGTLFDQVWPIQAVEYPKIILKIYTLLGVRLSLTQVLGVSNF
ncbi:unnamed protein product [Meloidogyne enterolobii]|uniref:Uncharacterized protein n=1 Tax=Meloidogyne enterolobii TaxID=390850 RepID=A0ACB0XPF2_MELEN